MKPTEDSDTLAFEITSEKSISTRERYLRKVDKSVLAPARVIWEDTRARIGAAIVLTYILMGTVGVAVIPVPEFGNAPRYLGFFESMQHPLGTNGNGEDLLALTVHATPPMLKMILSGALFATAMATIVGVVSGYKGGVTDRVLSTVTDIAMTIPGLPLIVVIAAVVNPRSPLVIGVILSINAWAGLARAIRSQVLTLREDSYVEAARIMGTPLHSILISDILPNIMPYVSVHFVNSARNVIFASVGLYFLGILPSSTLNWGVMLNRAFQEGALWKATLTHWLLVPMGAIVILSFGLLMLAQSADQLFNPRVRARHAKTIESENA